MATDTAIVTITVDTTVEANDDLATTPANTPVAIDVLANDLVNGAPVTSWGGSPTITVPPPQPMGLRYGTPTLTVSTTPRTRGSAAKTRSSTRSRRLAANSREASPSSQGGWQ